MAEGTEGQRESIVTKGVQKTPRETPPARSMPIPHPHDARAEQIGQEIIRNTVDGILLANPETRRLSAVNQLICDMLGYTREEMEVLTIADIHPEEDWSYIDEQFQKICRRQAVLAKNVRVRRKDDSIFFADINAFPITFDGNQWAVGFFRDATERRSLEIALAKATADERRRLAAHMHDGVAQQLSAVRLLATHFTSKLGHDSEYFELAVKLQTGIEEAQNQLRALCHGLFPVSVDAGGLSHALGKLAEETAGAYPVDCIFDYAEPVPLDDNFIATQLFLVAREAVLNAVKHARASRIIIRLHNHGGIKLTVSDDGIGMPEFPKETLGIGLRILRHRSDLMGGRLTIRQPANGGTEVICSVNV